MDIIYFAVAISTLVWLINAICFAAGELIKFDHALAQLH
jgi:hypothetical protein